MNDLKQRLSADHEELERQLRTLAAIDANDVACDLRECWNRFETSLLDHLDTEACTVFAVAASGHRQEVEALRVEHALIRRSLGELGLDVELHTLRKEAVGELITFRHRHAARENGALYDWLGHDAPEARPSLLAMFERRTHTSERGTQSTPASLR